MSCPLCSGILKQHLIQPEVAVIACSSESCIYPFNLSVTELHENNLILSVSTADIMNNMKAKMVNEANVDSKMAEFISREDPDIK